MEKQDVQNAERRLDKAEAKLRQATRIPPEESITHTSNVLTNSQRSIEYCAKAIFILMDVQEPTEHTIPVNSEYANQVLNAVYAEFGERYTEDTARILFLTELYGSTYPVSEYGVDIGQIRMESDDFLSQMEGNQAYNHAVEVVKETRKIIDESRRQCGMSIMKREGIIDSAYNQT